MKENDVKLKKKQNSVKVAKFAKTVKKVQKKCQKIANLQKKYRKKD